MLTLRFPVLRAPSALALTLLLGGCASMPPAHAGTPPSFEGAWMAEWCDKASPERECGRFELYLVQERGRLCGQHFAATPGLSRLDEGDPASVLGMQDGKKASFIITNTRNGSKLMATATLAGGQLRWRLEGMVVPGTNDEPAIIPLAQTLTRNTSEYAVRQWRDIKRTPCRWPDDLPRE
jgi:hypothetical protein